MGWLSYFYYKKYWCHRASETTPSRRFLLQIENLGFAEVFCDRRLRLQMSLKVEIHSSQAFFLSPMIICSLD